MNCQFIKKAVFGEVVWMDGRVFSKGIFELSSLKRKVPAVRGGGRENLQARDPFLAYY